jgi:hypothetical protein
MGEGKGEGSAEHLTPTTAVSAAPLSKDCVVYTLPLFQYAIGSTKPQEGRTISQVALQGCRGEYVTGTFLLYPQKELPELTLHPEQLESNGKSIPAESFNLRVVRVRERFANTRDKSRKLAPDALVKDDTLLFWDGADKDKKFPSAGTSWFVKTSIAPGTSRQFWITLHIPPDAAAGIYQGAVRIEGKGIETFRLPVALEVLPFELQTPKDVFWGIYRPYDIPAYGPLVPGNKELEEVYRRNLRNIREHGFTAVSIYQTEEATKWAMTILKEEGLTGPMQVPGASAELLRYSREHNLGKPVAYVYDEPSMDPKLLDSIKRSAWEKAQQGIDSMAAVDEGPARALADYIQYPVISSYFSTREGMYEAWRQYRRRGFHPLYYWQTPARNPRLHRLNCGYFFWQSGYEGSYPYAFQHGVGDYGPMFQEGYYTAPPGQDGPIDTVQWEACRVGVDDYRYLHTLHETIRQKEAQAQDKPDVLDKLAGIRAKARALLEKYSYENTAGWGQHDYSKMSYPESDVELGQGVPQAQFERDRDEIVRMIKDVLSLGKL